jgi:anaerobic selenocysteine-containing dehydrogenase
MKNASKSICPFCSMGCSLTLRAPVGVPYVGAEQLAALDYDRDGQRNRGSLCAKGNMALELLTTAARLEVPLLRRDGEQQPASWDETLEQVVTRLRAVALRDGPDRIGLLVGPNLTDQEAGLAAELARRLGTPHLDLFEPTDNAVLAGLRICGATPERVTSIDEIAAMRAQLLVGDVLSQAPCLAKPVLDARYDMRDNVTTTLASWNSRTALFGKPRLWCAPGGESAVLALLLDLLLEAQGEQGPAWSDEARATFERLGRGELEALGGLPVVELRWTAESLLREPNSQVVYGCGFGETERPDLVAGLCALIAEAIQGKLLVMSAGPNTAGVRRVLDGAGFPGTQGFTAPEMIEAAGTGDLAALLVLGADPLAGSPGDFAEDAVTGLDTLVVTGPLPSETGKVADVLLPSAVWGEVEGQVEDAFGGRSSLHAALSPPGAARPDAHILSTLCEHFDAGDEAGAPSHGGPPRGAQDVRFFGELELHFRIARRDRSSVEVGSHELYTRSYPSHTSDGWWTRPLSWPRHEQPRPVVALSAAHAAELGVEAGDTVRLRSRDESVQLEVALESRLAPGVVLVPSHEPRVRRLATWSLDPVLRQLDVRPARASVERIEEAPA